MEGWGAYSLGLECVKRKGKGRVNNLPIGELLNKQTNLRSRGRERQRQGQEDSGVKQRFS